MKRLTSLTIQADGLRLAHPSTVWRCISRLSDLRKLDLSFKEAEEWLFDVDAEVPNLEDLFSESSTANAALPIVPQLRPIAQTFKSLEWLRLASGRPKLRNAHFEKFPPSLTHLDVGGCAEVDVGLALFISKLPRLTSLTYPSRSLDGTPLNPPLPSNITQLRFRSEFTSTHAVTASIWSKHQSLTALNVNVDASQLVNLPLLQKLKISSFRDRKGLSFAHMPNLRELHSQASLSARHIDTLPKTLTSLRMISIHSKSAFTSAVSLPNLRTLHLADGQFEAKDLEALPQTLTDLQLPRGSFTLDPYASKLPPGLTHLHFMETGTFKLSSLRLLPRSLKRLAVTILLPSPSSPTILQDLAGVPPHLEMLTLDHAPAPIQRRNARDDVSKDPPILGWTVSMVEQVTKATDGYLTHLELWRMPPATWTAEHCAALPRQLRILNLSLCLLPNSSLPNLPPSLRELTLRPSTDSPKETMTSEGFQLLPRRLRVFMFFDSFQGVKKEHITALPTTLTRFNCRDLLAESEWTDISFFPRNCWFNLRASLTPALRRALVESEALPFMDTDRRVLDGDIAW